MDEKIFVAMDIPRETRKLVNSVTVTEGMTDSELKAYQMGVYNTLSALEAILDSDDAVVHVADIDVPTEIDVLKDL
jgi:hypothetical protein